MEPLHIGIDGFEANVDQKVGIGQYAFQIIFNLYKLDSVNTYTIFLPNSPESDMPPERKNWHYSIGKPGSFWTLRNLPRLMSKQKLDVMFSPTHYSPFLTAIPKVIAVMDLSYLSFPEMFRRKDLWQLKYMGFLSVKSAKKILTISEFSKNEIVKHYKVKEEDVVVTYPGINIKDQISNIKNTYKKLNMAKPYILFVGTIQPRKNIERLIEAFEELNEDDLRLVIVGKKGWLFEPILRRIEASPKREQIKYLDFVTDEQLANLYTNAACFCLPSLYEGFGIPVVEAMNYGCPVVTSDTTSLPEVVGDAGILVNPLSTQDVAQGLKKALQLSPVARKALVQKGREQIKKFSWEVSSRKTLEVLQSIV